MAVLSNPDKAKTRELREAVAAYQDHIGNHRGAALVRAQPDNFTEWSGYAHQLVTVMDTVSLKADLPKGIEGMLSYSREKAAEFAQNNRELAINNETFAKSRDSWGKRPQSENVIDRRDGIPDSQPSWGRDILDRGERGFAKIVAALMGDGGTDSGPKSTSDLARGIRRGYGSEVWTGVDPQTVDKHAWGAGGKPFGGAWYDRGEQLMREAFDQANANSKYQGKVGDDGGIDGPTYGNGDVTEVPGGLDFDGDGLPDLGDGSEVMQAAGGRQARPGFTVNSNTGEEFVNPSSYADPGLRAPASESYQRSMFGTQDIKGGWAPTKAPTPASDVASKAASKVAAKAIAAALAGDTAQMGNPDQTMADVSTFGEFAGLPDASSWSGEDGGDPDKAAMRAAATAPDAVMVDLVAPPDTPLASPYGLDEAFNDAYSALFGSPTTPEALDVDIADGYGKARSALANAASMGRKASALANAASPSTTLGAPTSPTASPALNSFGVFGSEAAFGTPSSSLADVDPMTAMTRGFPSLSTPTATAAPSLSPSQLSTAYNGFGQFGDEAKYGMSDAQAAIDADPMTAMTRGFPSASPDMAPATDTAMSAYGSFGGIGTPTADQAEAQRGMPGLSMAAMGGTPAIGIPSTKASALAPGLEGFNDAFQGSVKSIGPKYSKAIAEALATPSIANQVAVTKAAELYGNMNGKPSKAVRGLRAQQIADFAMANPALGDALGLSMGQQGSGPLGGGLGGDPFGRSGPMGGGPSGGSGGGFGGPTGQPSGPSFSGPSGPSAGPGGGYGGGTSGGQPSGPAGPTGPTGPGAGPGYSGSGNPAGSPSPGAAVTGRGPSSNPGSGGGLTAAQAAAIGAALAGAQADADAAAAASSDAARGFGGYSGFGGFF